MLSLPFMSQNQILNDFSTYDDSFFFCLFVCPFLARKMKKIKKYGMEFYQRHNFILKKKNKVGGGADL